MQGANPTPALRFEGFIDPWEQRKLGELIQLGGSGGTPSATNPSYYGGEVPFLSIADIDGRDITHTAKTLTEEGLNNSAAWIVPTGAVSLAMYASVGRVGIIRQNTATSQAFYNMVFESDAIRDFVFTRLEKADMDSEWEPYISTGTQRNLNADKVKSFALQVPEVNEAASISRYFHQLDDLITLHQRKCDRMKHLKAAMLDKMFPKPGEKYPELRFEGFTDPWEQRKLGDEFAFLKNNTLSRAELSDSEGAVRNIHYGDILTKFGSVLDAAHVGIPRIMNEETTRSLTNDQLRDGDVIVADTAEDEAVGKCTELRKLGINKVVSGLHTMPLRPYSRYAPGFLGHYLNSDAYRCQLKPLMQGIKVISVSRTALAETQLTVPSFDEQRQIGGYFSNLDSLITLHQRKCDRMKHLKAAMLDKMFI